MTSCSRITGDDLPDSTLGNAGGPCESVLGDADGFQKLMQEDFTWGGVGNRTHQLGGCHASIRKVVRWPLSVDRFTTGGHMSYMRHR